MVNMDKGPNREGERCGWRCLIFHQMSASMQICKNKSHRSDLFAWDSCKGLGFRVFLRCVQVLSNWVSVFCDPYLFVSFMHCMLCSIVWCSLRTWTEESPPPHSQVRIQVLYLLTHIFEFYTHLTYVMSWMQVNCCNVREWKLWTNWSLQA